MSYTVLEDQIRALPEEYLEEVSHYIEYILFREQQLKAESSAHTHQDYFGSLKNLPDGMAAQRSMRSEWN